MRSSKIKLHTDRALEAPNTMTHRNRWRFGVLASAVALLGSLCSIEAHALALGRVTVQSALGEALRAEVDIAEINVEEANSLRVAIGSAAAFKAAGLEYSAAVVGLQVSLQKRADGRSFLRLTSPRPVTEPFVDLVLEANWASGRVVRDYTLLFDPPNLRQAIGPTSVPSLSGGAAPRAARPTTSTAQSTASTEPPAPREVKPVPMAKAARAKAQTPQKAPGAAGNGQQVTVKNGDTASKIAGQNKPAGISLDQMLVALLKSNPDAFIGGNINRLKSGALLDLPTEETAGATSAGDATRTITAQAKDFNNFRRKLAEGAPTAQVAAADRQAGGKLQAKVEDNVSGAKTPDKLTLSKGAVQGKSAAEEKIAKDRQALAESTRVAELSKNTKDLDKLRSQAAAVSAAAPGAASSAAKAPGMAVPAPAAIPAIPAAPAPVAPAAVSASSAKPAVIAPAAPPAVVAPAPAAPAPAAAIAPVVTPASPAASVPAVPTSTVATSVSATVAASGSATVAAAAASAPAAPVAPASAVASKPVVAKKIVAPPPPPEPTFIESLTDSPFALPALAGLLALLGGFGYYRYKKKDSLAAVDSSFLESRLQPDSFFGASGGQRIDTSESSASGSSLVYSPSQLDAAGDVDPVAEADVYLAYGRDLQAEEILKEALRTTPTRVAIHSKLSEIYAKRRDIKGFESLASDAYALTKGDGPEWAYIAELGRDLDPANALYKPGGQPLAADASMGARGADFGHDTMPVSHATKVAASSGDQAVDDVDFDLDLDFSDAESPAAATASRAFAAPVPTASPSATAFRPEPTAMAMTSEPVPAFDSGSMDFDDVKVATQPMAIKAAAATDSSYAKTQPLVAIKPGAPAPAAVLDSGMLEFDMSSLSPGLSPSSGFGPIAAAAKPASAFVPEGPLETKFALAEEFRLLGDPDGARSLANEVVAQAQGSLKTKAQAFLNSLT